MARSLWPFSGKDPPGTVPRRKLDHRATSHPLASESTEAGGLFQLPVLLSAGRMMANLCRSSRETLKTTSWKHRRFNREARVLTFVMPSKKKQDSITYRKEPESLRTKVDIFLFNFPRKGGFCLNMCELC